MKRREFFFTLIAGMISIIGVSFLSGCMAPRIGENVWNKEAGDPYRCGRCGHLTRSKTDISGDRCPRCRARMQKRIREEQMTEYLKNETPSL